jgi:hypothetical protein
MKLVESYELRVHTNGALISFRRPPAPLVVAGSMVVAIDVK